MRLGDKAKAALVLCQQLSASQSLEGKRVYVEQLDQLWPDIRCRLDEGPHLPHIGRLCVFVLAERVQRIPRSLAFNAYYIEEVRKDGSAKVIKNKLGCVRGCPPGTILTRSTIELGTFDAVFNVPLAPTAWERIMEDDDF